jgi:hypothetical protein
MSRKRAAFSPPPSRSSEVIGATPLSDRLYST